MWNQLNADSVVQFHDRRLSGQETESIKMSDSIATVWFWIGENHQYNTLLWNEEDKARITDAPDIQIVASKRAIDRYNQERNDAVEAMDEMLLAALDCGRYAECARLHSETAGAMIDRLSILSLKIYHMRKQTKRTDADAQHIAACEAKLQRLNMQRQDLCSCLNALLDDTSGGRAYFKVYRQFKMYNDPALNPYLYGRKTQAAIDGLAV